MSKFRIAVIISGVLFVGIVGLYLRGELLLSREKLKTANNTIVSYEQTIRSARLYISRLKQSAQVNNKLIEELNASIRELKNENAEFQKALTGLNKDEDKNYLQSTIPVNVRRLLER